VCQIGAVAQCVSCCSQRVGNVHAHHLCLGSAATVRSVTPRWCAASRRPDPTLAPVHRSRCSPESYSTVEPDGHDVCLNFSHRRADREPPQPMSPSTPIHPYKAPIQRVHRRAAHTCLIAGPPPPAEDDTSMPNQTYAQCR
jgi:hypothetical protein